MDTTHSPRDLRLLAVSKGLRDCTYLDSYYDENEVRSAHAADKGLVLIDVAGAALAVCRARQLAERLENWPSIDGKSDVILVDAHNDALAAREVYGPACDVAARLAVAIRQCEISRATVEVTIADWSAEESEGTFETVTRRRPRRRDKPALQHTSAEQYASTVSVDATGVHPQTLVGMLCDYPVVRVPPRDARSSSVARGSWLVEARWDDGSDGAGNALVAFTCPSGCWDAARASISAWESRLRNRALYVTAAHIAPVTTASPITLQASIKLTIEVSPVPTKVAVAL